MKIFARWLILFLVTSAILLIALIKKGPAAGAAPDPWAHVLARVVRGGAPNADGPYASSYTRVYKSRAGVETTILLVDAPGRELAIAESLLAKGFVREAAFHLRNVTEFHGGTPEAAKAREGLAECRRRSPLEQVSPMTLVLSDGRRLMASVKMDVAGLTPADRDAMDAGRFEEVTWRHDGTGVAFALLYDAARAAKGGEAARLYREALALAHVPALAIVRPGDEPCRAVGFVDDALVVNATQIKDGPAIFFPESEFETAGAFVADRVYYEVEAGSLYESERKYKLKFLKDASAVLGESPDLERARVYWGDAPPEVMARHAGSADELDQAYDRALNSAPYLKIEAPTILTSGSELAVKLEWANLDRIRFRFTSINGGLPLEEAALKKHLESLRAADLPVSYEQTLAPAADLRLPLREDGTWRITAEAGGLSCAFFAVRTGPRLEALMFPAETVLLTNLPGLAVSAAGRLLGVEKDGAIHIGPVLGKYCSSHVECCKECASCAHHHTEDFKTISGAVPIFGCDGRTFFRAKVTMNSAGSPHGDIPPSGNVLYVYADRPVYRAGDTLNFRGILRGPPQKIDRASKSRFGVLPNEEVVVSILRDKETLFNRRFVTGEFGTFAGEFTLPLSTARAEYSLRVDCNSASATAPFEVIDYRKSDYVITLESRMGSVAVRAGYAWGAPVEGTTLKAFVKDAEVDVKDGRVMAANGDAVRVVLLRGDDQLASKSVIHREPAESTPSNAKEAAEAAASTPAESTGQTATLPAPVQAAPAIRTAKRIYGRGETIEVELSGPDGEALVVLGDVKAYDWQRVTLRGGRGVARFPTSAVLDPGATVFAVMGKTVERLPLDIDSQRMRVEVVPDKPSAKPGEDVGVTIRGFPGAEMSLAAVDEAIFMIREDATPELYGTFYRARPAAMAHAAFEEFTFEGETRQAERLPLDPRFRTVTRVRDRLFRDEADFTSVGMGGGAGGGGRYGGRFGGRQNLVARGGGTQATESAVLTNLRRLAELQQPDGSWGPGDTRTEFGTINAIGRSALALLSYLGCGYSHLSKDVYGAYCFGDVVKNGMKYLLRMQNSDGCIGQLTGDYVFNHVLATAVLSEAYGTSATQLYKAPAASALKFLASRQAGDGGWHPAGGGLGESPVTGLAVMALRSAQLSELDYSEAAAVGASRYFRALTKEDGSCPLSRTPGAPVTLLTTASAMYSFMLLDAHKREPKLCGIQRLIAQPPVASRPDYCGWYMGANAIFQYDGPDGPCWKKWNEPMKNALVPLQKDGLWGADLAPPDTVCMTGFAGLTLMVYYRYANVFGGPRGTGGEGAPGEIGKPLAPPPAIRVYFPDTALWIPSLMTDEKGEARATLRMPDSITTIRLTSRGVTKDTALGEGVGRIESRQPFFVNLKTPAFFVVGDEAEIRGEVFNYTGESVDTDVGLSGDGFSIVGESKRRIRVGASCESVSWRVRISEADKVRFLVETTHDAVEKTVPVKPLVPPAVRSFRGPVVTVPKGETPLDLVARISPQGSSLSKVLEALRFLNEYPHG